MRDGRTKIVTCKISFSALGSHKLCTITRIKRKGLIMVNNIETLYNQPTTNLQNKTKIVGFSANKWQLVLQQPQLLNFLRRELIISQVKIKIPLKIVTNPENILTTVTTVPSPNSSFLGTSSTPNTFGNTTLQTNQYNTPKIITAIPTRQYLLKEKKRTEEMRRVSQRKKEAR